VLLTTYCGGATSFTEQPVRTSVTRGRLGSLAAGLDDHDLTVDGTTEPTRVRLLLSAGACATGAALVIYITSRVSLAFAVVTLVTLSSTMFTVVLRRLDPVRRAAVLQRIRAGARAGVIATIAYDLARFGLVALAAMNFQPFHVFELFGQGLVGADAKGPAVFAAGAAFHLANGTGFGIAFALLVKRPTIVKGIVWAMFLELAMVALYPSWLQMQALGEFLEVSVLGHAVYGIVLGTLTRQRVRPQVRGGYAR